MRPSDLEKITFNCIRSWFLSDRNVTISIMKNWDINNYSHDRNIHFGNGLTHITSVSKNSGFWRFFAFSRKTRQIDERVFDILFSMTETIFPVTFNVPLGKLSVENDIKNKLEYKSLKKNELFRRWRQNFWALTNETCFEDKWGPQNGKFLLIFAKTLQIKYFSTK